MTVSPGRIALACVALGLLGLATGLTGAEPSPRKDPQGDLLPAGARVRLGSTRGRSSSPILFAAHLPGGKELVTVHLDATAQVSDAATGKELRRFGTPAASNTRTNPTAFAISADGKVLAIGRQQGVVSMWDLSTAKQRTSATVGQTTIPAAIALSPDGKLLAAQTPAQGVRLFDTASGEALRGVGKAEDRFYDGTPMVRGPTLAFSHDGKRLAILGTEPRAGGRILAVRIVDVETGWQVRHWQDDHAMRSDRFGSCLLFMPDGRGLLWTNGDGGLSLTEVATGKERRRFGPPQEAKLDGQICSLSANGRLLAVCELTQTGRKRMGFRLWDVTTGKQVRHFEAVATWPNTPELVFTSLNSFSLSPDGKTLAVAGGLNNQRLQVFAVATGLELQPQPGHEGSILAMVIGADGKTVTSCGTDQAVCRWDAAAGKEVGCSRLGATLVGNNLVAALSPDGKIAACAIKGNQVRIMDTATGKELHQLSIALPVTRTGKTGCLAFSPDGTLLAILGQDRFIRLINPATGREIDRPAPIGGRNATGVMFSPDGGLLAIISSSYVPPPPGGNIAGESMSLRFWDVMRGMAGLTCDLGNRAVTALALSPDSHCLAAAYADDTISLWETATGKERTRFAALARPSRILDLAFAPDGQTLVLARADGSLVACDAGTGNEIKSLPGHTAAVTQVTFAADGKSLLSGSMDTTLLLWDTKGLSPEARPARMDLEEKQVAALWAELADEDAGKAFVAMRGLAAAPNQAVPFLKERLKPVIAPDPRELAQLIVDLDDAGFATRQKAAAELERLGELAEPALRKALDNRPSLELRRRLEQLIEKLRLPTRTGDELRNQRALETLEALGTAEARQVIERLARGAGRARLTRAAADAAHRLNLREARRGEAQTR